MMSVRTVKGMFKGLALAAVCASATLAASSSGPAPGFQLSGRGGKNIDLTQYRGQVVMINFWATWCGPCRQEMPQLSKLYDKYRAAGFVLLGVNVDDDVRNATAVATKLGVSFPVLLDTDKTVSRQYDMGSMPATVLIDRDGRVRFLHRGYRDGMETEYDAQIRGLLRE